MRRSGFTLVELLIVVVILGVLAAILIPQLGASSDDAKLAQLDASLAAVRSALDRYYIDHGEYPSRNADGMGNGSDSPEAFVNQLTYYTDRDGDASTSRTPTHRFGPYLRLEGARSVEPMTDTVDLDIVSTPTLGLQADGGDPGGWKFNNQTGEFIVNHSAWDDR